MATPSAAILAPAGPALTAGERAFFAEAAPWGFIVFARNIVDPDALAALTADLRDAVGRNAPVLIDQEGGRVQRMRAPFWREWHPPLDQMTRAGPTNAARTMFLRAALIAQELRAVGIDVNCTPLADIARSTTHPFLRDRTYGGDPDSVVGAARAVAEGQASQGVLPVLKHMPGHGRGQVDSHTELPRVDAPAAELDARDFAAFRPLADLPMGMTAHVVYEALDPETPATLSPTIIDMIRTEIGFAGLLMTDDISMRALPGALADRAARARAAGCDLILHCTGARSEMEAVVSAAGALDGPARARAEAALACRREPAALDVEAAEAELSRLLQGRVYAERRDVG